MVRQKCTHYFVYEYFYSCFCWQIALIILAAIKLRQGIVLSSNTPMPNEVAAPPPPYAGSVYSVADAPFSPHPFNQSPAAGESGFKTDSPAYWTNDDVYRLHCLFYISICILHSMFSLHISGSPLFLLTRVDINKEHDVTNVYTIEKKNDLGLPHH